MTRDEANKLIQNYDDCLAATQEAILNHRGTVEINRRINKFEQARENMVVGMGAPAWEE